MISCLFFYICFFCFVYFYLLLNLYDICIIFGENSFLKGKSFDISVPFENTMLSGL